MIAGKGVTMSMHWQDESRDAQHATEAVGAIVLTAMTTLVIIGSIIAVGVTHNGAWYGLPFAFGGALACLHGALKPSMAAVCAGGLLLLAAFSIAGVI